MDENKFIDLSAIIKQIDVEKAKELLKSEGYFVDNLWRTFDVTDSWECTDEQAQEILYKALTNESTMECIIAAISFVAGDMNLKEI